MPKRTRGFTLVEIAIIIVVIAALASFTLVTYNNVQTQARDTKRENEIRIIKAALEKYHDENSEYPHPSDCAENTADECWKNQPFSFLQSQGYLSETYIPNAKSSIAARNVAPSGTSYYGWYSDAPDRYAIYVYQSTGDCKTGVNMSASWWSSLKSCSF